MLNYSSSEERDGENQQEEHNGSEECDGGNQLGGRNGSEECHGGNQLGEHNGSENALEGINRDDVTAQKTQWRESTGMT